MSVENYRRASKKQLEYIANMYERLGEINPTLYRKYSLADAGKLIVRLQRKLSKQKAEARQIRLL